MTSAEAPISNESPPPGNSRTLGSQGAAPGRCTLGSLTRIAAFGLGLLSLLLLPLVSAATEPDAHAPRSGGDLPWVIPAGSEAKVLQFLQPLAMGQPVALGYELDAVAIQNERITLKLVQRKTDQRASVDLLPPDAPTGLVAGPVRIQAIGATPPALLDFLRDNFAHTQRPAAPWSRLPPAPSRAPHEAPPSSSAPLPPPPRQSGASPASPPASQPASAAPAPRWGLPNYQAILEFLKPLKVDGLVPAEAAGSPGAKGPEGGQPAPSALTGYRLTGVEVQGDRIALRLRDNDSRDEALVWLLHPANAGPTGKLIPRILPGKNASAPLLAALQANFEEYPHAPDPWSRISGPLPFENVFRQVLPRHFAPLSRRSAAVRGLLVLLTACVLLAGVWRIRPPVLAGAAPTGRAEAWPTLLVGLAAFAWLAFVNVAPVNGADCARDFLMARDCVDLGVCHQMGPQTTVVGFFHGAVWIDLIAAVRFAGGESLAVLQVVLALLSLGIAALYSLTRRWLAPELALPAAVLTTVAVGCGKLPAALWNPSPALCFDVLGAGALLVAALTGRRLPLVAAAFLLGIAVDTHIATLALVPALLVVAGLMNDRPWRQVGLAIGAHLAPQLLLSFPTLWANTSALWQDPRRRLAVILGLGACVITGILFGRTFRALSSGARAVIVGILLVAPFGLGVLWLVAKEHYPFVSYYWHPVMGPGALLLTAMGLPLVRALGRHRGLLRTAAPALLPFLTSGAGAAMYLQDRGRWNGEIPGDWSYDDGRRVAEHLAEHGWSYGPLQTRLEGRNCLSLLRATSLYAPRTAPDAPAAPREAIRARKVPQSRVKEFPPTVETVPLRHGMTAVLSEIRSWIDTSQTRACWRSPGSGPSNCHLVTRANLEPGSENDFLFSHRAFPHTGDFPEDQPYVGTYELAVRPQAGESREIEFFSFDWRPECGWRVVRVEGLDVEESLPSSRVHLRSTTGQPGRLIVEKPYGTAACTAAITSDLTPGACFLETAPGEGFPPLEPLPDRTPPQHSHER